MIYTAKVIRNGGSQAIRLPKELRTTKKEVYVQRVGSVILLSDSSDPWSGLRKTSGMLPDLKRPVLPSKRRKSTSR